MTLKDPAVYVKSGRSWGGVFSVRPGSGKALDMLLKGINTTYVPPVETFFLRISRTYSKFNARLSDPNWKSTQRDAPMAMLEALARLHLVLASSNRP